MHFADQVAGRAIHPTKSGIDSPLRGRADHDKAPPVLQGREPRQALATGVFQGLTEELDLTAWCGGRQTTNQAWAVKVRHIQTAIDGQLTGAQACSPGLFEANCLIHQLGVCVIKTRLLKSEPLGEALEYPGIGQGAPERFNNRFRSLQVLMPIGAVQVPVFQMRAGRQNHLRAGH